MNMEMLKTSGGTADWLSLHYRISETVILADDLARARA